MKWSKYEMDKGIRGTLWLGEPYNSRGLGVEVSWKYNPRGFSLRMNEEDAGVTIHYGLHFVGLHFTFEKLIPQSWSKRMYAWAKQKAEQIPGMYAYQLDPMSRTVFDVREHDGTFWLDIWSTDDWSRDDKKKWPWLGNGWEFNWGWYDALVGEAEYEKVDVSERPVEIHLPEGAYEGVYKEYRCRWLRKRNPLSQRWFWRCEVDVPDGIPIPGKGTAAHNCGDTARFGTTFPISEAKPVPKFAAAEISVGVMKTRKRYAGDRWKPVKGWPAHCLYDGDRGEGTDYLQ